MRGMRGRWFQLVVATIVAAAAWASVPALGVGTAVASDRDIPLPRITWHRCPPRSAAFKARFTCATVHAPLQYQHPAGPWIKLAVVRHAASGPARRGVIFMNPGGPGFSGTVLIPAFIELIPKVLRREYDIVSWDPRGVGASTALQCFRNLDAENAFLGGDANFPARPGQQAGYIARWARFGRICKRQGGALLRHVSTADTARDLNLLRRELGQPKLNYIGVSYGTYVGATYANLFPRQVGKMVLDGNVAPTAWTNGGQPNARRSFLMRLGSTTGAARTLAAFLRICGQRSRHDCLFTAGTPAQTTAKWDALLARLRQGPITISRRIPRSPTPALSPGSSTRFSSSGRTPLRWPALQAGPPPLCCSNSCGTCVATRPGPARPLHRLRRRRSGGTPGPSRTSRSRAATLPPLQPVRSPAFSASYSGRGA